MRGLSVSCIIFQKFGVALLLWWLFKQTSCSSLCQYCRIGFPCTSVNWNLCMKRTGLISVTQSAHISKDWPVRPSAGFQGGRARIFWQQVNWRKLSDREEIRCRCCSQPAVSRLSVTERKNKCCSLLYSRQTHTTTKPFPLWMCKMSLEGFSRNWWEQLSVGSPSGRRSSFSWYTHLYCVWIIYCVCATFSKHFKLFFKSLARS